MASRSSRPRPALLRALGLNDPPERVEVAGRDYHRIEIYKHDSWAATACYSDGFRTIVCKFNRMQPIGILSTNWLGTRLARRERAALEKLADVSNVPNSLGDVSVNGRVWPTAVAREFVAGHPLQPGETVGAMFFPTLERTLRLMHDRGLAYVDLHKRENIIVGDDGRPYLIDFQIGFDAEHRRVRHWPGVRSFFEMLCQSDLYHFQKHVIRHDPQRAELGELEMAKLRPWWIRAHRLAAVPLREMRRRLLVAMGVRKGEGKVESEHFIEDGLRTPVRRKVA